MGSESHVKAPRHSNFLDAQRSGEESLQNSPLLKSRDGGKGKVKVGSSKKDAQKGKGKVGDSSSGGGRGNVISDPIVIESFPTPRDPTKVRPLHKHKAIVRGLDSGLGRKAIDYLHNMAKGREDRLVDPEKFVRDASDSRFHSVFQKDYYNSVFMSRTNPIVEMKWIDWDYIRNQRTKTSVISFVLVAKRMLEIAWSLPMIGVKR